MDAIFGSSHQQPKPGAEAAAGDEKDEPASEYRRLERFVVAWLVGDNAIFTFAALSKRMIRYNAMAIEIMVFPISMSLCLLYASVPSTRRPSVGVRSLSGFSSGSARP